MAKKRSFMTPFCNFGLRRGKGFVKRKSVTRYNSIHAGLGVGMGIP